jgi:hypothetical protein
MDRSPFRVAEAAGDKSIHPCWSTIVPGVERAIDLKGDEVFAADIGRVVGGGVAGSAEHGGHGGGRGTERWQRPGLLASRGWEGQCEIKESSQMSMERNAGKICSSQTRR